MSAPNWTEGQIKTLAAALPLVFRGLRGDVVAANAALSRLNDCCWHEPACEPGETCPDDGGPRACNADLGHPCDANDGEPCAACAQWLAESEREHRRSYAAATMLERDPARYEREMRDAGRGRLLP